MARNFYFGSDQSMVSGSATFSRLINEDAGAYGLSAELAAEYALVNAELQIAFTLATTPVTRTPVAVERKNTAVKSMQRSARYLSSIINAKETVDDAQLMALGLLPRAKRTRREAPRTPPRVNVVGVDGRIVKLKISDADATAALSKARNAVASQLFAYVGEAAPADASAFRFVGNFSRVNATVLFPDHVPSGATVWLSARWISARGEASPASPAMSFTIQGGPVRSGSGNIASPSSFTEPLLAA